MKDRNPKKKKKIETQEMKSLITQIKTVESLANRTEEVEKSNRDCR
jgi:hypothetical protein